MKPKKGQKLELTWVGKGERPRLEPRILVEEPDLSYGDKGQGNLLIQGDNLLALKALESEYAGKVKCIYIDPPYNTGSAFEHYDDGLEHSQWLNLMKPRLEILRNLLSEDGSIWVTLDHNEHAYLKVMLDEVFGRVNFKANITWQKKYSVSNNFKGIASICDYILVYSKGDAFQNNLLPRSQESESRYQNPDSDPRGPWKAVDYLNQATPQKRPNLCYDITNEFTGEVIKNTKKAWKYEKSVHLKHVQENKIWWGRDGKNSVPALKLFLSEVRDGMTPHNWWPHTEVGHTDEAKKEGIKIFGHGAIFDTPKPERLIERVLLLATNPNDLVLDSFLGSGTTAAVAQKMGRRWIGVELGEHAQTHCLPRLKKVVDGQDPGGISKAVDWKGGGGFRYYRLAPSLLKKDDEGNWVINPQYNAEMLAAAMAKQEGYQFEPAPDCFWKQGHLEGKSFIFTTTNYLSFDQAQHFEDSLGPDETLMVCCQAFEPGLESLKKVTLRKIPQAVLGRCEFDRDDYSLNIVNLPDLTEEEGEPEAPASPKKPKSKNSSDEDPQPTLF
ncbi:MAG: site-specific DNA-methyltransferase [bacterium]|nr:site-specific DNA-methyltransferase [bacterium]